MADIKHFTFGGKELEVEKAKVAEDAESGSPLKKELDKKATLPEKREGEATYPEFLLGADSWLVQLESGREIQIKATTYEFRSQKYKEYVTSFLRSGNNIKFTEGYDEKGEKVIVVSSTGGGGGGEDVSKDYVDQQDQAVLATTNERIEEVDERITNEENVRESGIQELRDTKADKPESGMNFPYKFEIIANPSSFGLKTYTFDFWGNHLEFTYDEILGLATHTKNGLMDMADKIKLDYFNDSLLKEIQDRQDADLKEQQARESSDKELKLAIEAEKIRAKLAESGLQDNINKEISDRKSADNILNSAILEEIERALGAESGLNEKIDLEIERAQRVESGIKADLAAEVARAKGEEYRIEHAHDAKFNALEEKDTELEGKITAEVNRAKGTEEDLQDAIDVEVARALRAESGINSDLTTEKQRSKNKDDEHDTAISGIKGRLESIDNSIDERIKAERIRAEGAESGLSDRIAAEVTAARAAEKEVRDGLAAEITRAKDAEGTLTTNLGNEVTRSTNEDKRLNNLIYNLINSESGERIRVDDELRQKFLDYLTTTEIIARLKTKADEFTIDYKTVKWGTDESGLRMLYSTIPDVLILKGIKESESELPTTGEKGDTWLVGPAESSKKDYWVNIPEDATPTTPKWWKVGDTSFDISQYLKIDDAEARYVNKETYNKEMAAEKQLRESGDNALDNKIDNLFGGLNTRLTTAETNITNAGKRIDDEVTARSTKDLELESGLTAEKLTRENKDTELEGKITQEVTDRKAADKTLESGITSEATTRAAQDTKLKGFIDTEEKARESGDKINADAIAAEVTRATNKENEIAGNLTTEINRAKAEEGKLDTAIKEESGLRKAGDDALRTRIEAEESGRIAADNQLNTKITEEEERATNRENAIDAKIDAEVIRASGEESRIEGLINAEKARAITRESGLEDAINTERTERTAKDTELQESINKVALDLAEEVLNRESGDNTLRTEIENEAERAKFEESGIKASIESFNTKLGLEEKVRQDADQANEKAINNEITRAKAAEAKKQDKLISQVNIAALASEKGFPVSLLSNKLIKIIVDGGDLDSETTKTINLTASFRGCDWSGFFDRAITDLPKSMLTPRVIGELNIASYGEHELPKELKENEFECYITKTDDTTESFVKGTDFTWTIEDQVGTFTVTQVGVDKLKEDDVKSGTLFIKTSGNWITTVVNEDCGKAWEENIESGGESGELPVAPRDDYRAPTSKDKIVVKGVAGGSFTSFDYIPEPDYKQGKIIIYGVNGCVDATFEYVKPIPIISNIENGGLDKEEPEYIDSPVVVTIVPDHGFSLPDTVTVEGATGVYDKDTGKLIIKDPVSSAEEITVAATCPEEGPEPLCFTAVEAGSTISGVIADPLTNPIDLQYSTDGENWNTFLQGTSGTAATVTLSNIGNKVYIKNNNNTLSETVTQLFSFTMTGKLKASGNINSMINYSELTTVCYAFLFGDPAAVSANDSLVDISDLKLPSVNLADGCYYAMFSGCTELTTVPELPAENLATYCYYSMFNGCEKLKINENGTGTKIFTCPDTTGLEDPVTNMFTNTTGSFTGTPTAGNTYNWYTE